MTVTIDTTLTIGYASTGANIKIKETFKFFVTAATVEKDFMKDTFAK